MALSKAARERLELAAVSKVVGKEISDAIDSAVAPAAQAAPAAAPAYAAPTADLAQAEAQIVALTTLVNQLRQDLIDAGILV